MVEEKEKKQIAVIGDEEFTVGFRLAGIDEVYTPENYSRKIKELIGKEELGIIIAEQEDLNNLEERVRKEVEESVDPVVVALSEEGTSGQINQKIQKVIGADIT